jgi:hypothetical protein
MRTHVFCWLSAALTCVIAIGCSSSSSNANNNGGSSNQTPSLPTNGGSDNVPTTSAGGTASNNPAAGTGGRTGPHGIAPPATGQIGDPCLPVDELAPNFSGFERAEFMFEESLVKPAGCTDITQCGVLQRPAESSCVEGACLVNHFQGRTSCPYGQTQYDPDAGQNGCLLPGTTLPVKVAVQAQLVARRANDTVYCSCICADSNGQTAGGSYCTCPAGFECTPVSSLAVGTTGWNASFCIKSGTVYKSGTVLEATCDRTLANCGS